MSGYLILSMQTLSLIHIFTVSGVPAIIGADTIIAIVSWILISLFFSNKYIEDSNNIQTNIS